MDRRIRASSSRYLALGGLKAVLWSSTGWKKSLQASNIQTFRIYHQCLAVGMEMNGRNDELFDGFNPYEKY